MFAVWFVFIVIVDVLGAVVAKSVVAVSAVQREDPPPEEAIVILPAALVTVIFDPAVIVALRNPVPSPMRREPLGGGVPDKTSESFAEGIVTVPVNVGDAVGAREVSDAWT
jgi:hypothetical protein